MACWDCLPLPGNQTLDKCLKEKHCIPIPMNGLKGAEVQSSFSGKTAGCQGNYFRQRMQELPNRGSEGFSSGLRNKTQCLNAHEKNLLGGGEMTQLVRCLPHNKHGVRIPSTDTEVKGVVKLSVISPGETETGGSLGLTGQSVQPDSVRFCLKTKGGEKLRKILSIDFWPLQPHTMHCIVMGSQVVTGTCMT